MRLKLSIVKFEVSGPELKKALESFGQNRFRALETLVEDAKNSVAGVISQLLAAEMTVFLGQPEQSDNRKNGSYERDYAFKGLGTVRLRMPTDRKSRFASVIVPKHERMDPRLSEDLAALHLAGISTRMLAVMGKRILGVEVSHQTISAALPMLAEEATKWLKRPLTKRYWALIVDGSYFHIRRRGSVEKEPALVVLGIDESNRRSILAIEPGQRDNADTWRSLFRDLKARGLATDGVQIGVMDGLPGLESVFREEFPVAVTARCWFHAMSNALAKTPKRLTDAFHTLAKRVMYASGEDAAREAFAALKEAMGDDAARAIACLEKDLDSLVSHYNFPELLWRALKTSNAVERIHKEVKRRAKAMEAMGETTLTTLVAFTALRLEMKWQHRPIDSYVTKQLRGKGGAGIVIKAESDGEGDVIFN
jgi:putative transposase